MKRTLLLLMTALLSVNIYSQENPERGFIITNENDTVYGTIDFRTDEINAQQCYFKADNADEYKFYFPGDIVGYRFMRNGKFYVSKVLEYEGVKHTLFAEYMIKGMLSVYRIKGLASEDLYFFENENGKMVAYRNYNEMDGFYDKKDLIKNSQNLYSFLASSSLNASKSVKIGEMSPNQILDIARTYHDDVCTSGEDCIKYEYDERSDKSKSSFFAYAGVCHLFSNDDCKYGSVSPLVGVGWDWNRDRQWKGMTMQFIVELTSVKEITKDNWNNDQTETFLLPIVKFGMQHKNGRDNGAKFTYRYGVSTPIFCMYAGIGTEIPFDTGGAFIALLNASSPCILGKSEYMGNISASIGFKF